MKVFFVFPWVEKTILVARFEGLTTIPRVESSSDSRGLVCPETSDISSES